MNDRVNTKEVISNGMTTTPFLIGVAGGTASGKTTVCRKIIEELGQHKVDLQQRKVCILSQDSFYKQLSDQERDDANNADYNFDHPDAFDNDLLVKTLRQISQGQTVKIPIYDFKTHSRLPDHRTVYPADVVLFEGILVLYSSEVREMLQMKLFVDTDSDTRLARRVLRDIQERGRELEQVLTQYTQFVKPAFEEFCLPVSDRIT